MSRPDPLSTLREVAQRDHDECTRRYAEEIERVRQIDGKRELLESFRSDYDRRLRQGAATDARRLAALHAFVARLDAAIQEQQRHCAAAQAGVAAARAAWDEARRRCKSLEVLDARNAAAARRLEDRAARRQQDEFAARMVNAAARAVAEGADGR